MKKTLKIITSIIGIFIFTLFLFLYFLFSPVGSGQWELDNFEKITQKDIYIDKNPSSGFVFLVNGSIDDSLTILAEDISLDRKHTINYLGSKILMKGNYENQEFLRFDYYSKGHVRFSCIPFNKKIKGKIKIMWSAY